MRILIAGLLLLGLACGDDDTGPAPDMGAASADAATPVDAMVAVDAPAADTWTGWAEGFFATYCVDCHAGDPRDYRTITDVLRDRDPIRCGVSPTALDGCGAFPPPAQFPVGTGPKPTDAERERLVAWIDAGAPE